MERGGGELRIGWTGRTLPSSRADVRHFIGLHAASATDSIQGALVRVIGRGLAVSVDVLATASWNAGRTEIGLAGEGSPGPLDWTPVDSAEAAAEVALSLSNRMLADQGTVTAIGLEGLGTWRDDLVNGRSYTPHCDTARLARLTGLTVVDDFPGRDLAHDGRGGPCGAAGFWLLLGDRGTVPGRRIRALLDLDDMVRLILLPPRQSGHLPPHLLAYDVAPGTRLLTSLARRLLDHAEATDIRGKMAVQGKLLDPLLRDWLNELPPLPVPWRPEGDLLDPLWRILDTHLAEHQVSIPDILCTAVHLIARRVIQLVKTQLPRSQPVGQLVLGGPAQRNGLLLREIRRQLPEVEFTPIDAWGIPSPARWAAATALLAQLMIDQVPANGTGLTGAQLPRILGRLTPGSPANWHQVLVDMAVTLPIKLPLRDAV